MIQAFTKLVAIAGMTGLSIVATQVLSATAASAEDMYGAIATSDDTGAWGYAYNYPTRAQAEAAALQECGEAGC
jgi:serine/threonine-protein kinase